MRKEKEQKKTVDDEEKILSTLLVDEKYVLKELTPLVEKAKDIFVIEKPTGKVIFKDFDKLNDRQRICALLIGRFFAVRLKLLKEDSLRISEITDELERPMTTLFDNIKYLIKKGYIKKLESKKYIVVYYRIKYIFHTYFSDQK